LSGIFFVATANVVDKVPQALRDHMEILHLSGYSDEEKTHIAHRFLVPRQRSEAGLAPDDLTVTDASLHRIIRNYTREAGVRALNRTLELLCRKVAVRAAAGASPARTVAPDDLADLLGPVPFFAEDARPTCAPGVAANLAWTETGGDVLYVEAVLLHEGEDFTLTGQRNDLMREAARTAMSYVAAHSAHLDIDTGIFRAGIHIHVPAGATTKDGPAAGVAMATALASLLTDRTVRSDTAMTGAITVSGRVLPVRGVREKVLAAHRAGLRHVILPRPNDKDLRGVPEHLRETLVFTLADRIEDVLAAAIPELAKRLGVVETT
jgi:ATP-dependent Lon protease